METRAARPTLLFASRFFERAQETASLVEFTGTATLGRLIVERVSWRCLPTAFTVICASPAVERTRAPCRTAFLFPPVHVNPATKPHPSPYGMPTHLTSMTASLTGSLRCVAENTILWHNSCFSLHIFLLYLLSTFIYLCFLPGRRAVRVPALSTTCDTVNKDSVCVYVSCFSFYCCLSVSFTILLLFFLRGLRPGWVIQAESA